MTPASGSSQRPLRDLRHAFKLDDYPMEGFVSGDFHVYGPYERPFGFGKMQIDEGVAYGETFERATSSLRFEGNGVRLDSLEMQKSTGAMTGAAFVGWDGDYSFNADGTRIPVESLKTATVPQAPLSGLLQFNASGAGTFDDPRYDVKLRVDDLFAGDEGIGQLNGRLSLRGELLTLEMEAASPRLVVSGSGRIALTPEMDTELAVRFADTSLDPYVRFFEPRLSPFTNAVAGGTIRVVGELADVDHLVVETHIESLDLKLFDYRLRNKGTIDLSLDQHVLKIDQLQLTGEGTELQVAGPGGVRPNELVGAGVRRCQPRASCRASIATCAAAARPRSRPRSAVRSTSRCSPAAPTSPTAGSACCRCRTRSRRSTGGFRSTPAAFDSTTWRPGWAKETCGSAAGSASADSRWAS